MDKLGDILQKFNPKVDKYVSVEYQTFGIFLAEKLGDSKKKSLYIQYAKNFPRSVLEAAYRFVIDSNARNKGALFIWKLKELGAFEKYKFERAKKGAPKIKSTPRERKVKAISKKLREPSLF